MKTCDDCIHLSACRQWYPKLPDAHHYLCECFTEGWISCEDHLPKIGEHVLTLGKTGHVRDRILKQLSNREKVFWPDNLEPVISITHWMPMLPLLKKPQSE